MSRCCFVFFQGGIGEKGAEGTAGNDGARVRDLLERATNVHYRSLSDELALNFNSNVTHADLLSRM